MTPHEEAVKALTEHILFQIASRCKPKAIEDFLADQLASAEKIAYEKGYEDGQRSLQP